MSEVVEVESRAWGVVDLDQGAGLAELAGFASTAQVSQSGLDIADRAYLRDSDFDRFVDELLFLATRNVRYRAQALAGDGAQVVREWRRIQREGATCLDLALVVGAQLLESDLRPHLVLRFADPAAIDGENHALLLLHRASRRTSKAPWPDGAGSIARSGVAGWAPTGSLGDEWLVLDPTTLLDGSDRGDPDMSRRRLHRAEAGGVAALQVPGRFFLIDLAVAQTTMAGAPRRLPDPNTLHGLSLRLPPASDFVRFRSRRPLLERLDAVAGTVVLAGPPGRGKSVLAIHHAGNGLGWVVNGSSKEALCSSLAEQEGRELNVPVGVVASDVDGHAEGALTRLRETEGPWTVVVDNANLAPWELSGYLPRPDPARGQKVLVTTTEGEAWRSVGLVLEVGPLDAMDAWTHINGGPGNRPDATSLARLDGLPLLTSALRRLKDSGRADLVAEVLAADDPVVHHWQVARRTLDDPQESRAAQVAALLPADLVPTAVYERLLGRGARDLLGRLVAAGVLTRSADTWSLHRLFGTAIRDDDDHALRVEVAVEIGRDAECVDFLARAYDPTVLTRLRDVVVAGPAADEMSGRALVGLATVIDARGTAEEAARMAEAALRMLGPTSDPSLRATCLLGIARRINQKRNPTGEEIARAIEQAVAARDLIQDGPDRAATAKCLAMEGLLIKRDATFLPVGSPGRLARLVEAHGRIEDALRVREEVYADRPMHLELAKARFNMGGVSIELAKLHQGDHARFLDAAERGYRLAEEARLTAYGTLAHRHVASCTAGLGTVAYYRAVLGGPQGDCTPDALREVTRQLVRALEARERLEPHDDVDVLKTLRVLSKTLLVRVVAHEAQRNRPVVLDGPDLSPPVLAEYRQELAWAWPETSAPRSSLLPTPEGRP